MKKITLILTSMLFLLVGGVKADPVNLNLSGGQNVSCANKDGYTEVTFNHTAFNGRWNGYYGDDWVTTLPSGKKHRFVFTFKSGVSSDLTLHFVVTTVLDWNNDNSKKIIDVTIGEGETSFQYDVETEYGGVFLINTGTNGAKLEVVSVTREEIAASSVAAPTISPASGTYDGDLTVTITKGAGNDKVVYSVSGATTGNETNAEFTTDSKPLTLTGTGTITVTAKGVKGSNESSEVTNTYTYGIPSGNKNITENIPHTFNSWDNGNSITIDNSNFSNIKEGDYVVFGVANVAQNGTVLGFRDSWNESPYSGCTTTSGGNGAKGTLNIGDTQWWMKVNSDVVNSLKNNTVRMQGGMVPKETAGTESDVTSSVTLNSLNVYECKALNESSDNLISSKINHVVVELTRSFTANTWNTVCLPFVPTSAQATQLFGSDYQLAEFTNVSGTTMQFTTINIAAFEAGKPYLVMPKTGCATGTTVLFDVNITAKNPTPVTWGDYTFTGTFTTKEFTSADNTTSRFVATGNKLVKPNENSTLKSLRCYFTVPAATPTARSLSFDIDEEGGTTSINTVQGSGVMVNGYYNLAGQRVAQPTKGLYIVNGKKVVIK